MWLGSQSTCHPTMPPDTPLEPHASSNTLLTPLVPPKGPLMPPTPPRSLNAPYATYTLLASEYYTPFQPPIHPWHSQYTPDAPSIPWMLATPPRSPKKAPLCHLYPSGWPLSTNNPCQLPIHPDIPIQPWYPLTAPWCPYTPGSPNAPLCHLYPFWLLSTYTPCQPPIHPWHALHPQCPKHHLTSPKPPSFHVQLSSLCSWPSSCS